jgi:DNA-binding Lrp family transcriptional regulator
MGCDHLIEDNTLDMKDLDILTALEKKGGKASAKELSEILDIPARTVRYRLAKLKKSGILVRTYPVTHERKLGIGEHILVMRETSKGRRLLPKILDAIPCCYWFSPSYGKYDGFVTQSLYPLSAPNTNRDLLAALQKADLISDYHVFDIVDYGYNRLNLSYYNPVSGWDWDPSKWIAQIDKNIQSEKTVKIDMDENPRLVDFDNKDMHILKLLIKDMDTTIKEFSKIVGLSETQITKRIKELENKNIIKGYKSLIRPFGETMLFQIHLDLKEPLDAVLASFYQLPFAAYVMMESKTRFCIRFDLPIRNYVGLLKGIDYIRPHVEDYFIQTAHNYQLSSTSTPFELYNPETRKWEVLVREYIETIETLANEG